MKKKFRVDSFFFDFDIVVSHYMYPFTSRTLSVAVNISTKTVLCAHLDKSLATYTCDLFFFFLGCSDNHREM